MLKAPVGADGFVQDFDTRSDTNEAILGFFSTYGFVVFRNVLSVAESEATVSEFFATNAPNGLDRADPNTWADFFSSQRFSHLGIMGGRPDLLSLRQLENRQNQRVHEAYSTILGCDQLWVDHDRLGVMRPTKNIDFGGGQPTVDDVQEWRTVSNWLHLDCNPSSVAHGVGKASIGGFSDDQSPIDFKETLIIQSLLTLTDARVEDGGFHCVPGSHKATLAWAAENQQHGSSSNMQVPEDDAMQGSVQEIPIRAGCLLAWSSMLLHGNHPNRSESWRAVQYIRAMKTAGTPYSPLAPNPEWYNPAFRPSELGRRLFGMTAWGAEESVFKCG
jgi:hypothetical protein